jgi:hypothetical protein
VPAPLPMYSAQERGALVPLIVTVMDRAGRHTAVRRPSASTC